MKTLIFTLTMALIAFGSFAIQPAYAHCGMCGEGHAETGEMKPCEKCLESGKPCEKCMKKMDHGHGTMHINGEKEPCAECAKSEIAEPISPTVVTTTTTSSNVTVIETTDRSNIGSLHMLSGQTNNTNYND